MVDPGLALLIFGLVVLLLVLLFWPQRGLVPLLGRNLRHTGRVVAEDALKHLFKAHRAGRNGTLESLAGVLQLPRAKVARLVARLEASGLLRTTEQGLALSEEGRDYALRIVRSHRLWERYLADRTGLTPAEWHEEAEKREHTLTPADAETLSARMGHPRYDPHGDPIPTEGLKMPPAKGRALTSLEPGDTALIVHLEDEPRETYQLLVEQGLAPQMEVRFLEAGPSRVRFLGEGREHSLAPIAAANITVVPIDSVDEETLLAGRRTLASIPLGGSAEVLGIAAACQGGQRRRLLDLGVVPGTTVKAEFSSSGGDPTAYRIRGALIALRRQQAEWIYVTPAQVTAEGEAVA